VGVAIEVRIERVILIILSTQILIALSKPKFVMVETIASMVKTKFPNFVVTRIVAKDFSNAKMLELKTTNIMIVLNLPI